MAAVLLFHCPISHPLKCTGCHDNHRENTWSIAKYRAEFMSRETAIMQWNITIEWWVLNLGFHNISQQQSNWTTNEFCGRHATSAALDLTSRLHPLHGHRWGWGVRSGVVEVASDMVIFCFIGGSVGLVPQLLFWRPRSDSQHSAGHMSGGKKKIFKKVGTAVHQNGCLKWYLSCSFFTNQEIFEIGRCTETSDMLEMC